MSEKAQLIDKRHTKQCSICMLIDSQDKKMEWHVWKDGYYEEKDSYICNNCLEDIKEIRKKCHQKVDNPAHELFKDYMPWFVKDIPGLMADFLKGRA